MKQKRVKTKLSFLIWLVAVTTIVACLSGASFLGYNVSGYAWAIPLSLSIIIFLQNPEKIRFPVMIWLPWICVVAGYLIFAEAENAFQRSVMLLCPLFIGMTASKYKVGDNELSSFRRLYRYMAISLYVVVVFKTGLLFTGDIAENFRPCCRVMTGALLCTLFATNYMFGQKKRSCLVGGPLSDTDYRPYKNGYDRHRPFTAADLRANEDT